MSRRLRHGVALLSVVAVMGCAPALPAGYHVEASGDRTANSEDQVTQGIKRLADQVDRSEVLHTELPHELTAVPVPANAIARRYERKQRSIDFCGSWKFGYTGAETPSLDDPKELREDAAESLNSLHDIDPNKRIADLSIRVKRGETAKRRLPTDIKLLLPRLESFAHAYYAQLYFIEQLDKRGKLSSADRHVLIQRALDLIASPEASAAYYTVNTYYVVHCLGGPA
jgi:hypothetical protein